jgi:hypothetical protein
MRFILALLVSLSVAAADVIPVDTLADFEGGTNGAAVTSLQLTNGTRGSTFSGWITTTDATSSGPTPGTLTTMKFDTNASAQLYTPVSIGGTTYTGSGTNGIRVTMDALNSAALVLPGYNLSVGFFFRFNGAQVDNGPRDCVYLLDTEGQAHALQIYDGAGDPYFHCHWGSGAGNNVTFSRSHWYWATMNWPQNGGQRRIIFYDAETEGGLTLHGESSANVTDSPTLCRRIIFGNNYYGTSASQSLDFDNFLISTNGVFPLGPGGGPDVLMRRATLNGTATLNNFRQQ